MSGKSFDFLSHTRAWNFQVTSQMAQHFVGSGQNLCLLKRQHRSLRKKDLNIPRGQGAQTTWKETSYSGNPGPTGHFPTKFRISSPRAQLQPACPGLDSAQHKEDSQATTTASECHVGCPQQTKPYITQLVQGCSLFSLKKLPVVAGLGKWCF